MHGELWQRNLPNPSEGKTVRVMRVEGLKLVRDRRCGAQWRNRHFVRSGGKHEIGLSGWH